MKLHNQIPQCLVPPCPKPFQVSVGQIRLKLKKEKRRRKKKSLCRQTPRLYTFLYWTLFSICFASPKKFCWNISSSFFFHHRFVLFYFFTYFIGASGKWRNRGMFNQKLFPHFIYCEFRFPSKRCFCSLLLPSLEFIPRI